MRIKTITTTRKLAGAFTAWALVVSTSALAGNFEWTLSRLSAGKAAQVLTDRAQSVYLPSGWFCEVGALTGSGGYESRTTTCRKESEEFRFVVQCEADHPIDHVKIQFGPKGNWDYVEVLCAPKKVSLLPNTSLERTRGE